MDASDPMTMSGHEGDNIACELEFFHEKVEVLELIASMCKDGVTEGEFDVLGDTLSKRLLKYLEQSQLIRPHICDLLVPLNERLSITIDNYSLVSPQPTITSQVQNVSKILHLLCRVAGYKYVMKHLLHEVHHLEGCLFMLKRQHHSDFTNWETSYVLLLWLSALCLIPFDICSMDSTLLVHRKNSDGIDTHPAAFDASSLIDDIISICKSYLCQTGPAREAASICLSSLLTRPDMENAVLNSFVEWAMAILQSWLTLSEEVRSCLTVEYFQLLGILHCLFQIFKLGHRQKLLSFGSKLFSICLELTCISHQTAVRKLLTKLIQRIGMNFLAPKVAPWRYLRGSRSLCLGSLLTTDNNMSIEEPDNSLGDDCDTEVFDEVEEALDRLITLLHDKDTVIRWSAAKGIGRITMRLPKDSAADIVDAVISSFDDSHADSRWHGGCLALAELSRRGLLLPDRLHEVIPFIERAIHFDVLRGQHSIGSHVRDAACYVCWAFSRAYSPAVMAPFTAAVTTALLTTALFDREVNCRRAASAAYQETVGRQGDQNVSYGIEIITVVDYYSIGNRSSCYTSLAHTVASINRQLNGSFLVHLQEAKLSHWDKQIRQLASKAVASLALIDVPFTLHLLSQLAIECTSSNVNVRHGSILATAELLFKLISHNVAVPSTLISEIVEIVPNINKNRLFRGKGGEQIREAVCELIQSIAMSKVPMVTKQQVTYVESLNEHLRQPHEGIQLAARSALREFLYSYFSFGDSAPSDRLQKLTVLKYMEGLESDNNASVTRGYALALGVLPLRLVVQPVGRLHDVLKVLSTSSNSSKKVGGEYDADTCRNSLDALIELAERIFTSYALSVDLFQQCFEALMRASEDYSVDKRGDTGSWCRVLSMKGMERLVNAYRRRQQLSVTVVSLDPEFNVVCGMTVDTSLGGALVKGVLASSTDRVSVEVSFPKQTIGDSQLHSNSAIIIVNKGQLCGNSFQLSQNAQLYDACPKDLISEALIVKFISVIVKQLSEKLDSVREVAGNVLCRLISEADDTKHIPSILDIPDRLLIVQALMTRSVGDGDMFDRSSSDYLSSILADNYLESINWNHPNHVYPIVCCLLQSELYFYSVLSGIAISVGGLTETTSKVSASSLLSYCSYLKRHSPERIDKIAFSLVRIISENTKVDRVVIPTIKTIEILIREGAFAGCSADVINSFSQSMLTLLISECRCSSSVAKLCSTLDVFVHLISICRSPLRLSLMEATVGMVTHKYPRVRKYCAELLYLYFLGDDDAVDSSPDLQSTTKFFRTQEQLQEVLHVLSSVSWDSEDGKTLIIAARWSITDMLGFDLGPIRALSVAHDALMSKGASKSSGPDELDSYEALVRDVGY